MMTDKSSRIQSLDVFRGIAVVLVLLFHYTSRIPYQHLGSEKPPLVVVDWGWIGVYVFFVVSGFCISATLRRNEGAIRFAIRRLARILPPYFAAVLFAFVVIKTLTVPEYDLETQEYYELSASFVDVVANLLFLREIGFPWLDGVFWSLLVELKFYLFIALIYLVLRRPDETLRLFYICSSIVCGIWLLCYAFDYHTLALVLKHLLIAPYLPFFCLGIVLNDWGRSAVGKERQNAVYSIGVFLLLCIAVFMVREDSPTSILAYAVLTCMLIATVMLPKFGEFVGRFFGVVGKVGLLSYSLYLVHNNLGLAIIRALNQYVDIHVSILVAAIVSLLLAFVSYRTLETFVVRRVLARVLARVEKFQKHKNEAAVS